jgi:DNA-binding transcriptional regulator YdaS (Cro superfamily)
MKKSSSLRRWIVRMGGRASVASILGVDRSTVRHWDNGRNFPRPEEMAKIRHLSKGAVSFDELIDLHFNGKN